MNIEHCPDNRIQPEDTLLLHTCPSALRGSSEGLYQGEVMDEVQDSPKSDDSLINLVTPPTQLGQNNCMQDKMESLQ